MYIQDFSNFSYRKQPVTYVIYASVLILSFITTVFVGTHTPDQPGAKLYFTLPLTLFFCLIFFKKIFPYHEGGFALKIFYAVCIIRYIFMPYFTCVVGRFASNWSSFAFTYAIVIQDIELIVSFVAINYYYRKQYFLISTQLSNKTTTFYEDMNLGGWIVIVIALLLIAIRGIDALASSMRFLVISDKIESEDYYGYDRWMAQTMQAFLAIIVTSFFQKRNVRKKSFWNIIIPLVVCLLSCTVVFGNNRMMMVYFGLSALSILSVSFAEYKKGISVVVVLAMAVVLFSFTMVKQYRVDITQGESANIENEGLAGEIAVYVSGTEAIAKAYDMYQITGNQMQPLTLFADIVDKTPLMRLPGMPFARWVYNVTPSYRLAMTGHEIVPAAGQSLYYGGYTFGWLLDVIAFWLVMLLMVKLEIHSKLEINLGSRYIYTWTSVVCAMVMCYHFGIMYNAFAYVPFFLLVALTINRKIVMRKKSAIRNVEIY